MNVLTVSENLKIWADDIVNLLQQLLQGSSVEPGEWMGWDKWGELDDSIRQVQSRVLEEYQRFSSTLEFFLNKQPENTIKNFQESKKIILSVIQQDWEQNTSFGNSDLAFSEAEKAIGEQIKLLNRLYTISQNKFVIVPDTNALLFNPDIQNWSFDSIEQFSIVLMPTVLSELDKLKMDSRSESVRQKSEKLIRQIKEYKRRGKLTEGVPIVKNKIQLVAIAVEPKNSASLSWLDLDNNDDQLLASCFEIMRQMLNSQVILSTRDINLQNKAEFAHLSFVEPPKVIETN
jgi:hypothetical protein